MKSISRAVIHSTTMKKVVNERDDGYFRLGTSWQECADSEDIVKKVKADPNGVGFLQCRGVMPTGVKILPVAVDADHAPVKPTDGPFIQPEYPLAEPLVLYLHPTEPEAAKRFCEFCIGPEGSAIAGKFGLITPYMQKQAEGKARLAEMKSGTGMRISMVGNEVGRSACQEAAVEYARAKAVIQPSYGSTNDDVVSIGAFVAGSEEGRQLRELLVLDDKPSSKALEKYGKQCNELMPEEFCIAGRATAIIVNGGNKLKSLTMGQVAAIFSGEADDWNIIGQTGLSAPVGGAGGKGIPIHRFGVPGTDPASVILYKNCLPELDVQRGAAPNARPAAGPGERPGARPGAGGAPLVTLKKNTAEVLAAVSMDPNAIGFIDLASLPGGGLSLDALAKAGQTVKVLAIQLGTGDKAKLVSPTPANIRSAMYPLSQRIYLYVHPKAGDTAKDFAKFVATCGGSEVTPYADTVKSVMDAFVKNGLIPLGDAALDRIAKDEIEAAKAKAEAEAAKSKPKPRK
jgi:ABC-type phosphate transport system substrate-binding protein